MAYHAFGSSIGFDHIAATLSRSNPTPGSLWVSGDFSALNPYQRNGTDPFAGCCVYISHGSGVRPILGGIILLAFIPNPLFDMAGFIAGAGKVPLWKFLIFTWIGKVAKMLLFAYLGAGIFGSV